MWTSEIGLHAGKLSALLFVLILCLSHPALCQFSDDMPGMDMGAPQPDTAKAVELACVGRTVAEGPSAMLNRAICRAGHNNPRLKIRGKKNGTL